MVIIRFPNGSDWYKANWAFRRLAEDIVAGHPDESDLKVEMERAEVLGLLLLGSDARCAFVEDDGSYAMGSSGYGER